MITQPLLSNQSFVSGITGVDTSVFDWPGYTFSHSASSRGSLVSDSYAALAQALGRPADSIIRCSQVHGSTVVTAPCESSTEADAIICARPEFVIGVKVADCCGVVFADPTSRVVAVAHSGWRGTAQNIIQRVVDRLESEYHVDPQNLLVGLSACASGKNYQVGEDVFRVLGQWCIEEKRADGKWTGKWTFDNHLALTHQLQTSGVRPENISIDTRCTIADRQLHSHRRDGNLAGRGFVFVGVRYR